MSDSPVLRLGTRRSPLARAQSGQVARALEAANPGLRVELVPIETLGDRTQGDLAPLGGKGLFTRELEDGLLAGALDLAVHSLKDLPVTLPQGLTVAAYPERVDPRDALVSAVGSSLAALPSGAELLTGSLRRRAQILARRPDLHVEPLRGNVDTRLRKWRERGAAGVILAAAGLARLGLAAGDDLPLHPLDPAEMLPAPGQGILALETRIDGPARDACRRLDHLATRRAADAERGVVAAFGGDCTLPLAAYARSAGERLQLTAFLGRPDGGATATAEAFGDDPAEVAGACVDALRTRGAEAILAALRASFPKGS